MKVQAVSPDNIYASLLILPCKYNLLPLHIGILFFQSFLGLIQTYNSYNRYIILFRRLHVTAFYVYYITLYFYI